jgi:hypothetical protein
LYEQEDATVKKLILTEVVDPEFRAEVPKGGKCLKTELDAVANHFHKGDNAATMHQ